MLSRFLIKRVTSAQIKEVIESCGKATFVISPTENGLWNISVCLKHLEIDNLRKKGYHLDRIPG